MGEPYECQECHVTKPASDFNANKTVRRGHQSKCKECLKEIRRQVASNRTPEEQAAWTKRNNELSAAYRRNYNLVKKYGITAKDFDRMWSDQGKRCAGCRRSEDEIGLASDGRSQLHVDHCHKKGNTRSILCFPCNASLGLMREDPVALQHLADYISAFG